MTLVFVGINPARNVFAAQGVNEPGRTERVRPEVACGKLGERIAALAPCTIGMVHGGLLGRASPDAGVSGP